MQDQHLDKNQWTELFRASGLDDKMMHTWHQLFEQRHPQEHEAFLQWLAIAPDEIERIRHNARRG